MRNSNLQHNEQSVVRANLRSLLLLTDSWQLSRREANALIGLSGLHSIAHWQSRPDDVALTEYQSERLSYVLSICKTLDVQFDNQKEAAQWLREPNTLPVFSGKAPLSILSSDNISDLKKVAQWLLSCEK